MSTSTQKTVLFFPVNAVGHINATMAIADRLKRDYNYRTVYLLLGPTIDTIEKHGHELIVIQEKQPYEDYEVEEGEDLTITRAELEQAKRQAGKTKKQFPGHLKWPQATHRLQHLFRTDPLQGTVELLRWLSSTTFNQMVACYSDIKQTIDSIAPDLIVFDASMPPLCVLQEEYERPWVQLRSLNPLGLVESKLAGGVAPPAYIGVKLYSKQERQRMMTEEPDRWQEILAYWKQSNDLLVEECRKAHRAARQHLDSNGCFRHEKENAAFLIESPHLNIYLYPEDLDYDQEDDILHYSPNWFRCNSLIRLDGGGGGSAGGEQNSSELDYWQRELERGMRGKQELVLFSLGSIASGDEKLVKKYIDMLKDDDKRLYVVSKGLNGDNIQLNAANMIGANYIPQTWFLQRARLAIIHGGNNGLTECMHYGVPMIVLPAFSDQLDNAQRVDDLGLGRRLNLYETSKQELRQTIDELLRDEALHEKMQQIGRRMRERDDLGKISIMLKKLIDEKQLSQQYIDECRQRSLKEVTENAPQVHLEGS